MHDFAIVALLGLAAYKTVDFLTGLLKNEDRNVRAFALIAVSILATELLDYSVFAGWKVAVRNTWMGPVFTGLMVAGMSYLWHEALGLLEGIGRHHRDEAIEIERRTPRAA